MHHRPAGPQRHLPERQRQSLRRRAPAAPGRSRRPTRRRSDQDIGAGDRAPAGPRPRSRRAGQGRCRGRSPRAFARAPAPWWRSRWNRRSRRTRASTPASPVRRRSPAPRSSGARCTGTSGGSWPRPARGRGRSGGGPLRSSTAPRLKSSPCARICRPLAVPVVDDDGVALARRVLLDHDGVGARAAPPRR